MKLVVQELTIDAPPPVVYDLFTDAARFVEWMAEDATLDATPGGEIRWTHANGDTCSGRYVELVPHRRVVFTYGWERVEVQIPPGSTTVEIDLIADGADCTRVRLVHRGLDDLMADAHHGGWTHYLARAEAGRRGTTTGTGPVRGSPRADAGGAAPVSTPTDDEERFWALAESLLELPGVTRSTMMGFPCLRVDGAFFASWDRTNGALVVKLPEAVVDQLVDAGRAEPFAPAGRRFREWASIPPARRRAWRKLLEQALEHVSMLPPPRPRSPR